MSVVAAVCIFRKQGYIEIADSRPGVIAVLPDADVAALLHNVRPVGIDILKLIFSVDIENEQSLGGKIVMHEPEAFGELGAFRYMIYTVKAEKKVEYG